MERERLIKECEDIVKSHMSNFDPSHDELHVFRVRRMALRIAGSLSEVDHLVVEIAALFHDLMDHKYAQEQETSSEDLNRFLNQHGVDPKQIALILQIIDNTSYSTEMKLRAKGHWTWQQTCKELQCVQDADRLDAIGSFGLFRAAAYSGATNRPLFHANPQVSTAYTHFYDKLLKLKDGMKTEIGKAVAVKRHAIMAKAIDEMKDEYELNDFP